MTMPANQPERLPEAEMDVLASLMHLGRATARELCNLMEPRRPMTAGAMMTLLGRLERKGFVARAKDTVIKAYVYRPLSEPKRFYNRITGDVVQRLFAGNGVRMFASLLETRPPSSGEIDELQRMLDELRARRGDEGGS